MVNGKSHILTVLFLLFHTLAFAQLWEPHQKLVASDRGEQNLFGFSLATSGEQIMVSSKWAGVIYIFERDSLGDFQEIQKLDASDVPHPPGFELLMGNDVAIDNNFAVIGVFEDDTDEEGGDTTSYAGAAYIFERNLEGKWEYLQKLVALDRKPHGQFGSFVAIQGSTILVSSLYDPFLIPPFYRQDSTYYFSSVYVFQRDSTGFWQETQKLLADDGAVFDGFGGSIALSGKFALIGAVGEQQDENENNPLEDAGAVYLFKEDQSGNWSQVQKIVPSDRAEFDQFGSFVDLEGNVAAVGAYWKNEQDHDHAGAVYLFEKTVDDSLREVQKLRPSDIRSADWFGANLDLGGDYLAVGAIRRSSPFAGEGVGAAYLFERGGDGSWREVQKIPPANPNSSDWFGSECLVKEKYAFFGVPHENRDVNDENYLLSSGAVYVYELSQMATDRAQELERQAIKLYPNPSKGKFSLAFDEVMRWGMLKIYNNKGRKISQKSFQNTQMLTDFLLGPPGIYVVHLSFLDNQSVSFKILKK